MKTDEKKPDATGCPSDADYIAGLKSGDEKITKAFFYKLCAYTLNDIRSSLMKNAVDYDELANELYLYLSENNWHKLDTFAGLNHCTLRSWMVRLAWRFFMNRRERRPPVVDADIYDVPLAAPADGIDVAIRMDVEATFERMPNKKYVRVLVWMLVEGLSAEETAERLGTSVANVYNIKHRAIVQFVEIYNSER